MTEAGQAPVAVKAEHGAEPMKVDEAPPVKAEPMGSSTPATPAGQPRSGQTSAASDKAQQQAPITPASQLRSTARDGGGSSGASPSPFV